MSFSERYRHAEPTPAWRRALEPGRLADVAQTLVAVALPVAVGYLGWLSATWSDRPATTVPTLVVAGARDRLLPEDALDALARAASPLTVWNVARAGHTDTRARAGAAYPERVLSFFSEHLPSR